MNFSLVIPCFNEAKNIPILINKYKKFLKDSNNELILVNNGSIDNTEKVLNKQKNKYWNYPEEKRLYAKKHYEKNKEKYKPTKRKYWIKNRKRDLVKNKLWRIENIEHLKSYKKEQAALINANTAKRRAMKLCATPGWTNLDLVKEFYLIAKEKTFQEGIDYEVDHMIPLQGENVCGFHCQNNLQVITAVENYSKGNKLIGKYTKLSPIL